MTLKEIGTLLNMGDIRVHTVYIGAGAYGFVYASRKGRYHIFISDSLSPEAARKVLFHEIHHIKKDMPKKPYIIGLDMQKAECENTADIFAKELAADYAVK